MNARSILIALAVLVLQSTVVAQKVKYKDIYALLQKKQYEAAEPLLTKYLEKEKNNPNAVLYMGIVKMDKYQKIQATDGQAAKQAKDDAIRYLNEAREAVDEWEVSKNEKYYTAYRRRNLRTGEMEVSVSDIQYDIDNRLKKLAGEEKQGGTE